DFIICADSGYYHALNMNIKPNIIIGDFDSYKNSLPKDIKIIKTIPEKDDTDTIMAIRYAISNNFDNCFIFGGLGGRLDHSYANITGLNMLLKNGVKANIIDEKSSCFLLKNNEIEIKRNDSYYISIFPFGEKAEGVTLKNVKYPLLNYTLNNTHPIGISNEFISTSNPIIKVKNGTILIFLIKK
ncbi:MAG: thiamine diphosphokinase, partial [Oscillospiraceae bacterium]